MRKTCALVILLVFAGFLFVRARESKQTKSLALTNVTIIDIANGVARPDMTVLIDGEQITAVGPANKLRVPNGAEVIDAGGKFLIPGLWDMHVHWFGLDNKYLGLFIANGVTGIRVMWGTELHFDLRKQTQQGTLLAPRMIIAGTIVDGLHDELGLMVQAGLSPIEALRTATINPARFLGLEQSLGTVEKGKIANLVLLDANPLLDIANTKKINAVVVNGRLLNRSGLDKILSDIESLSRN